MKIFFGFFTVILLFAGCSKSDTSYVNNPDAPDYLHNKSVRASARELLASTTFQSLRIEVLYMTGFAPDAAGINHLQTALANLTANGGK